MISMPRNSVRKLSDGQQQADAVQRRQQQRYELAVVARSRRATMQQHRQRQRQHDRLGQRTAAARPRSGRRTAPPCSRTMQQPGAAAAAAATTITRQQQRRARALPAISQHDQHDDAGEQQVLGQHRGQDRVASSSASRLRHCAGRSSRRAPRQPRSAHELLVLLGGELGLAHRPVGEQAQREHRGDDRAPGSASRAGRGRRAAGAAPCPRRTGSAARTAACRARPAPRRRPRVARDDQRIAAAREVQRPRGG